MARIDVTFIDDVTLDLLDVAAMVIVPCKGEDVRLMRANGSEVAGAVSSVLWTIRYDSFGNPIAQNVEVFLLVYGDIIEEG